MVDKMRVLSSVQEGDLAARELLPLVYDALRNLAAVRIANEADAQTLQATALVHEAYVRLAPAHKGSPLWKSRGHFFAAAAIAMRRILIDRARAKATRKRGGGLAKVELNAAQIRLDDDPDMLLDLDEATNRLELEDPRKAQLVRLRLFAGLSTPEAAGILGIAPRTAREDWAYARAWLYRELRRGWASE
jgi:RNA polymerase sigma factor (TIGR02999 family)